MRNNSDKIEMNILGKTSKIIGDINSDGDFRIDGTLEGTLKTNGKVIIGVNGSIKGKVEADYAEIEGKFSGDLKVDKTLTVKTTAFISGDVAIGKLSVEPGATFNATCVMKDAETELNKTDDKKQLIQKQAAK